MKKIFILLLLVFCLTGCSNGNQLKEFSDLIIESHRNQDVDISKLNTYNQEVFNNFLDQQLVEKKVINLSNLIMFGGEDFDTDENDTESVYFEKGKYYIKYTDLNFVKINDLEIATIIAGGYELEIFKDLVPVLYSETNKERFNYRYMGFKEYDGYVNYYYRSYTDGSMLTIKYTLIDNKISNVDLIYDYAFSVDEELNIEDTNMKLNTWNIILIVLFGVVILAVIVLTLIYKKKEA